MVLIPKFSERARVKNFGEVIVAVQLNPLDTDITFSNGDADKLPTVFPFRLSHIVSQETIQVDSLVSGDKFNITRVVEGGSAGIILAGELMLLSLTQFMWEHMTERISRLERMYIKRFNISVNSVYYDGTTDDWKVTEDSPQAMSVEVTPGFGAISDEPCEQEVTATVIIVAPGSDKYIGIIQYTLGVGMNVKYGAIDASPSAPSTDANSLNLAEILIDTGDTIIIDSQITQDLSALYF